MSITPSQVSLVYKKSFSPPFVVIEMDYVLNPAQTQIKIENKPPWLKLIAESIDEENQKRTFKVTIDPTAANNLAAGNYYNKINVYEKYWIEVFGNNSRQDHYFDLNLKVVDTVRLSLSKQDFSFNYIIGDTPPENQFLAITTENNWSIILDKPWATVSNANGSGNRTVFLGVNVDGLAPGIYESGFIVDDGQDTKSGTITLLINGPTEDEDYLDISHTGLTFSEKLGEAPVSQATINISTSLQVDVTTETPWLALSASSFAEGDHTLTLSTQNTEALAVGSYRGTVKIASGYSTKVVNVLLRIVEIITTGIQNDGFYFADDRNVLFLSTTAENAEALLEFAAYTANNISFYKKRVPFFDNAVETIVGLETGKLLKPTDLPALNSGIFAPIVPIKYDLDIFDKQLNSNSLTERSSFNNLQFVNGKTPAVENRLTHLPDKITTTKDGKIAFSFISEDPINAINITGDVTQAIVVTKPSGKIFTAVVDLATLNLKAQNKIKISCGPVEIDVVIREIELETFQLIWLNEWNCPEVINFDGSIEMVEEDDSTKVTVAASGKEISKIIEVKEPSSFRITTGNLYSDEESKWLSKILRSKKSWLQLPGKRVEVIRTFNSLSVSKSREYNRNYSLTFDAAER
ncbi:hypothetical protein JM79_2775 [Gramella sp. Hel_I_59]|uniref:BACON domain-containing protein n=1 Tax=Gramella sp. Hel_I_59 TaxID=1249978 RepID=UPI001153B035|nr:BACON domain-containing protein [Gramella sp. Hel_I_59]TQI71826.1 hypothetical protein JM79_2775 [Gramella sp. Hel_I_59]